MIVGAAAAPAAVEGALALTLLLAFVVSYGLMLVYRATLRRILLGLASAVDDVGIPTGVRRIHPLRPLASALRGVDGLISDGLAKAVLATEGGAVWLIDLAKRQIAWLGDEISGLAYDVAARFQRVTTVEIPNAYRGTQTAVWRRLHGIESRATVLAQTIAADVGAISAGLRDVRGYTRRLLRRLRRLERLLAPAAFAAAVGVALSRLGLKVLRCPQFLRTARRACGMNPQYLEGLLADTLLIVGAVSLVEFAEEMQAITGEVSGAIHHLIREA